jgi:general stress protein YciG
MTDPIVNPVTYQTSQDNDATTGAQGPAVVKQRRGFAAMDPAKQREIAARGGRRSHEKGTGHEWSREAAREAGRKGGLASRSGRALKSRKEDEAGGEGSGGAE